MTSGHAKSEPDSLQIGYPKEWDTCARCGEAITEQDQPMLHRNGMMTHHNPPCNPT